FSPDGKILAVRTPDDTFHLLEAITGKKLFELEGHGGRPISCLAFAPDGLTLATGSDDTTVLVWDLRPPGWDPARQPKVLIPQELNRLWAYLELPIALEAYRAGWT